MLRCKLILDRKPRAIIFENVVPFPIALLKDVTGVVCIACMHTYCDDPYKIYVYIVYLFDI